jgi:hypothetical protein
LVKAYKEEEIMKRIILTMCAVVAFSASLFAQLSFPTGIWVRSLENSTTGTLSLNEIDQSFTANDAFGSVSNPFLLGRATEGSNVYDLGYYHGGSIPFSVYGSFSASGLNTPIPNSYTDTAYSSVAVTSGTTTTNENWVSQTTDYSYALPSTLARLLGEFQGLFAIGGVKTGIQFLFNPDWSSTNNSAADYVTTTTTYNYNTTAATPNTAPIAATDYTTTIVNKNIANIASYAYGTVLPTLFTNNPATGANVIDSDYQLAIPLFLKTGSLEHTAFVGVQLRGADASGSYSSNRSAAANTILGTISDQSLNLNASSNQTVIEVNYMLSFPGLFGASNKNKFSIGVDVKDAITSSKYNYDLTTMNYTAGAVNTKTFATGTDSNIDISFAATNYIGITAMAKHSFRFESAAGSFFDLEPQIVLQYSNDPNNAYENAENGSAYSAIASEIVTYGNKPLDSSGVYDGTTYSQTTDAIGGSAGGTTQFGVGLNLPIGYKFKPESWPFGFFAGSIPTLSFAWQTVTTSGQTDTSTTNTYTGSNVSGTSVNTTVSSQSSTTQLIPTISEIHGFGIFVPLQNNIRADIALNGTEALFANSITLQFYIPLK